MRGIDKVTTDRFEDEVIGSEQPVLVEFTTSGCPACHAARPMLERLADEYDGRAKIVEVNVEEEEPLGSLFQIRAVPTLAFFKKGEVVNGMVGAPAPFVIRRALDQMIGSCEPKG
jgi:thioredoxin 1